MNSMKFKIIYAGKDIEKEGLKFSSSIKASNSKGILFINFYQIDAYLNDTSINYMIWDLSPFYFSDRMDLGRIYMPGSNALIINHEELDGCIESVMNDFYKANEDKALGIIIGEAIKRGGFKNIKTMKEAFKYLNENAGREY
jgi:hypothetical protein